MKNNKIITVFGSKGGVGKTTVAVNLATVLSLKGYRTSLLDFDLQFGDASVYLDLDSKQGICELVQEGSLSKDMIQSYMMTHKTGLSLLSASERPEYAEIVQSKHGEEIINCIYPEFDFTFIDLSPQMNEFNLSALEKADLILYVVNPDISTLRSAKKTLELMKALKLANKVEVVLNREDDSIIKAKEIESLMKLKFIYKIPVESKYAVASLNQGVPIVMNARKCKMAKRLTEFAIKIGEGNYGVTGEA